MFQLTFFTVLPNYGVLADLVINIWRRQPLDDQHIYETDFRI